MAMPILNFRVKYRYRSKFVEIIGYDLRLISYSHRSISLSPISHDFYLSINVNTFSLDHVGLILPKLIRNNLNLESNKGVNQLNS